jgi:hypothetical protein
MIENSNERDRRIHLTIEENPHNNPYWECVPICLSNFYLENNMS